MAITSYDLCLAWNWEHDVDFVKLLEDACLSQELTLLQVTPENISDCIQALRNHELSFRALLDRASDIDVRFMSLIEWACAQNIYCINSYEQACITWNKAEMHLILLEAGVPTPYTMILPSHAEKPVLSPLDLRLFGEQFIIKPAHGSGGKGVVTHATSMEHIEAARKEYATDKYLVQAQICPKDLDGRRAWFRVIYCTGRVFPCWWDPHTHIYAQVTQAEESLYGLGLLRDLTASIAELAGIDLFSTEIAFTPQGLFMVIDYVNDQIDLRLQSKTMDGVPDEVVQGVAEGLAGRLAAQCKPSFKWMDALKVTKYT